MQHYSAIEAPIKIKATADSILYRTAQNILLALVRGTDDVLRKVKLPVVFVLGLKSFFFPTTTAAQKGVKTIFTKKQSITPIDDRSF